MRRKMLSISIMIVLFCIGSSYRTVLQPHFTLSQTSVELGMQEEFDPFSYVLKNGRSIEEEDKEFIFMEGEVSTQIPGDYEITYNQYMKLQVHVKDTQDPVIHVKPFMVGLGLPFAWDEENLKKVIVNDNYTKEEELRKKIACENIDTAYLGDKEITCRVSDEAGNISSATFVVSIEKTGTEAYSKFKDLEELPFNSMQKEEIVQVLTLMNQERSKANLEPVALGDIELMKITYLRSQEVQKLYSHNRPNGEICYTILDEHQYSYQSVGENVAKGQQSALEVMQDWMDSEDHRSIILTKEFTKVGISVVGEGEHKVWTLIFIH